jgi:hypothetical protein
MTAAGVAAVAAPHQVFGGEDEVSSFPVEIPAFLQRFLFLTATCFCLYRVTGGEFDWRLGAGVGLAASTGYGRILTIFHAIKINR